MMAEYGVVLAVIAVIVVVALTPCRAPSPVH
jgi:Flp pilus assembly pilin Flp